MNACTNDILTNEPIFQPEFEIEKATTSPALSQSFRNVLRRGRALEKELEQKYEMDRAG